MQKESLCKEVNTTVTHVHYQLDQVLLVSVGVTGKVFLIHKAQACISVSPSEERGTQCSVLGANLNSRICAHTKRRSSS